MQFNFDCEHILATDHDGLAIIDSANINTIRPVYLNIIHQIIDVLGKASAKSQRGNLNYVSTAAFKFFKTGTERIYFKAKEDKVIGFLRVGYRKHSFRDKQQNYNVRNALTVIDFYIHFDHQGKGFGKELFDKMLVSENVLPYQLVYDSPNAIMLKFLEKHYQLTQFISQTDGLIVFESFFYNQDNTNNLKFTKMSSNEKDFREREQSTLYNNMRSSVDKNSIKPFASPQLQDKKYFANYYLNNLLASNNQFLGQIKKFPLQERGINSVTPNYSYNYDQPFLQESYIKEKLSVATSGIDEKRNRMKLLESHISPDRKKIQEYMKRNDYKTILDLKSVRPKEALNYNQYSEDLNKVNTPTSYGVYGSYYNVNNNNNNI